MSEEIEHPGKSASVDTLHNVVSIVAAYVGNNSLRAADLPELIGSVHLAINRLAGTSQEPAAAKTPDSPAIAVKKSVTRDYIVCLEDGKKFKSLRRHLSSFHGLTPEAYRAKWNLPSDYPMVAPTYSATRSQLAKESGLGQVTRAADHQDHDPQDTSHQDAAHRDHTPTVADPTEAPKKAGRGRPRKIPKEAAA
jgi:predicted transcriptional regulator